MMPQSPEMQRARHVQSLALTLAALGEAPPVEHAQGATGAVEKTPSRGKLAAAERQLRARFAGKPRGVAEAELRAHLRANPGDAPALRLLADMLAGDGRIQAACRLLTRALELVGGYDAARQAYAMLLLRQGKDMAAVPELERVCAAEPGHLGLDLARAGALARSGAAERSLALHEVLLRQNARNVGLRLSYGSVLKSLGRHAAAAQAWRECLADAPGNGEAHWNLAALGLQGDIPELRARLAAGDEAPDDLVHLHYALASALDKAGDYAGSFVHMQAGARIRRAGISYSSETTTAQLREAKRFFTASRLAGAVRRHVEATPIFIVGLPRAGSTLVEQILASHPDVEALGELPELGHILAGLSGYPACLAGADLAALGQQYIASTRPWRRTGRAFFTDKMPANWAAIGLIHLILPEAKIIDVRRHPVATCFAAFRQVFARGQNFSYDLTELGRYHAEYAGFLAHVDTVLPGRIHRVSYESVVTDTEAEIRRLLAHCGLAFSPCCLRYWETPRIIATASAAQVRQPIFRESLDHWRHYAQFLEPLVDALG